LDSTYHIIIWPLLRRWTELCLDERARRLRSPRCSADHWSDLVINLPGEAVLDKCYGSWVWWGNQGANIIIYGAVGMYCGKRWSAVGWKWGIVLISIPIIILVSTSPSPSTEHWSGIFYVAGRQVL